MQARPKIWGNLLAEVVRAGLCTRCSACAASCPVDAIDMAGPNGDPVLTGRCVLCQICYHVCPRTGISISDIERKVFGRTRRSEEAFGVYISAYSIRARDWGLLRKCQDGGAVSALLGYALSSEIIGEAIVVDRDEGWLPIPRIAAGPADASACAGSKFVVAPTIFKAKEAGLGFPNSKIAIVALPCQLQSIRKMQASHFTYAKLSERIALTLGLFCTRAFTRDGLPKALSEAGVNPRSASRIIARGSELKVQVGEGEVSMPIARIGPHLMGSCDYCTDFTSELADLSFGSTGSEIGWTTVITRSNLGDELVRGAIKSGAVEYKPLGDEGLRAIIEESRKKGKRDASKYLRD
ncbi:MAG: Coenzyme F420 hydrogenase/dehydrogenase, beta subunit C-terminal domain [Candidatus Bathyarchaeia archaeon]